MNNLLEDIARAAEEIVNHSHRPEDHDVRMWARSIIQDAENCQKIFMQHYADKHQLEEEGGT